MSGLTLLASVALAASTVKGHEIEQVVVTRAPKRDGKDRPPTRRRMTVFIARDRVRLQQEDDSATIVRLDKGVAYNVDDFVRSYERTSFEAIRKQRKVRDRLTMEKIEGMPPWHAKRAELVDDLTDGPAKWEQVWKLALGEPRSRLVAKYRLPEEPPLRVVVRRTDATQEVGGVECRRYESLENERVTDWALVAEDLPFDRRYYEFMELAGWLGPELAEGLRRAKGPRRGRGLPLETSMQFRTGGSIEIRTEAVSPRELDASIFEVPEGYKERKARSSFR